LGNVVLNNDDLRSCVKDGGRVDATIDKDIKVLKRQAKGRRLVVGRGGVIGGVVMNHYVHTM